MKSIKKFGLLGIVFFGLTTNGFCGGYPVIDITAILGQIDILYQTYEQVMNTVESVKAAKEQVQQAYDRVANFSLDDIKNAAQNYANSLKSIDSWEALADKDKVLNTRSQLKNLISTTMEKRTNLEKDLTSALNTQITTSDGSSYSLAGLFGMSHNSEDGNVFDLATNVVKNIKTVGNKEVDLWTDKLSYDDKKKIANAWDLGTDTYIESRLTSELATEGLNKLAAKRQARKNNQENGELTSFDKSFAVAEGSITAIEGAGDSDSQRLDAVVTTQVGVLQNQVEMAESQAEFFETIGDVERAKMKREEIKEMKERLNRQKELADIVTAGRNQSEVAVYY